MKSSGTLKNLPEIGSEVSINSKGLKDNIPEEEIKDLINNPKGRIMDYKLTDGLGIGFVVKLNNGKIKWFFENELLTTKGEPIHLENEEILSFKEDNILDTNKEIAYLLNPLSFINWFIYSTKDIL